MANIVTISGMFGNNKTYFADSPVVIDISGLEWPTDPETHEPTSPFNVVCIEVVYNSDVVGYFRVDTGAQSSISIDISTALRALWGDIDFSGEVAKAQEALAGSTVRTYSRSTRAYALRLHTEYLSSDDGGVYTETPCTDGEGHTDIPGGQCLIGGLTEMERAMIEHKEDADVSHWEHTNLRNGDASTKPSTVPERVGRNSITSWADIQAGFTKTAFYPASAVPGADSTSQHAPLVLRDDTLDYTDFLFVNRRGAVETCSALMKEEMSISVKTKSYSRIERPQFKPSRSLMTLSQGGRRRWSMSSGLQTREWAEWWTMEFLMAQQWWMLYNGRWWPVIIEPAKENTSIYNRNSQQMPSVEFTVTLALEG